MSKLFVQVERVEDLMGRVDDYFTQPEQKPKPMTHADRIRAMSDEELADYLRWHNDLYSRNGMDWLDWLKQEDKRND